MSKIRDPAEFDTLAEYINHLPSRISELDVPLWHSGFHDDIELPRNIFMRFRNLTKIIFVTPMVSKRDKIVMTKLPELPSSLEEFDCSNLNLLELPALPLSLKKLNCARNKLKKLPALPYKLQELRCSRNELTKLPTLPNELKWLYANENRLTELPYLPLTLTDLCCSYNELTSLPNLNERLEYLDASYNKLTRLPKIPSSLQQLCIINNELSILPPFTKKIHNILAFHNPFPFHYIDPYHIPKQLAIFRIKNDRLIRFKQLFYALKFKKQFRSWLWEKVREPKIREKYHPDNLMKMLEECGEDDVDKFEQLMEQW